MRALSSHRAFHWAYGGEVTAGKIAHFLILNPQCPRALITCVAGINNHLGRIAKLYGRETDAQAKANALMAELDAVTVDKIFDEGLHEFLTRFIKESAQLAAIVNETYLSGDLR